MIIKFFPRHLEASMNYLLHNWDTFEQELMIISKVKNEAGNIQEWIEYHKLVGVEKFIIFDNESTDNLQDYNLILIPAK